MLKVDPSPWIPETKSHTHKKNPFLLFFKNHHHILLPTQFEENSKYFTFKCKCCFCSIPRSFFYIILLIYRSLV